jgi:hypothetical protein
MFTVYWAFGYQTEKHAGKEKSNWYHNSMEDMTEVVAFTYLPREGEWEFRSGV